MLPAEILATFFTAAVLLALAPGPDNLFVLTQSTIHGKRAGIMVTLGLATGLIVHTLAVVLGVATIIQTSAIAFTILKMAGAAYLIYLAWGAWHAPTMVNTGETTPRLSSGKLYRRGIVMNITNPKVTIFFLAFLPQFTNPTYGDLSLQMISLGGLFIVATLLIFGFVAILSGSMGGWLSKSEIGQKVINRLAGTIFGGLAIRLAMESR